MITERSPEKLIMENFEKKMELGKVYKYNPLILASMTIKEQGRNDLNNVDILVFNFILQQYQKQIRQKLFVETNHLSFTMDFDDFKHLFPENPNWVRATLRSLRRIRRAEVEFQKIKVPKGIIENNTLFSNTLNQDDFETLNFHVCSLLSSISGFEKREEKVSFIFDPVIAFCAWTKKNYTHISLETIKELKSKYSQKLYEFIEYYLSINKKKDSREIIEISLTDKNIQEIFAPKEKSSFSLILKKINQENILVKDLSQVYENFEFQKGKKEVIIKLTPQNRKN